jgi:hypothetical protein
MRRRRRLRVVDRVGVGLDRSAARGVDERDKAGDAEVYDLAGQGREWRGPYYVLDNLRNLAQIRRVISRRDDVRQRHCAGDISESDDGVLVEGHENLIPMLRPAVPNLTESRTSWDEQLTPLRALPLRRKSRAAAHVPFDDKTSWKLWPPSVLHRKTKHNASRGAVTAITARSKKGGRKPSLPPTLSKEHYVGGEDVNRDANCAPNVNNPSR